MPGTPISITRSTPRPNHETGAEPPARRVVDADDEPAPPRTVAELVALRNLQAAQREAEIRSWVQRVADEEAAGRAAGDPGSATPDRPTSLPDRTPVGHDHAGRSAESRPVTRLTQGRPAGRERS